MKDLRTWGFPTNNVMVGGKGYYAMCASYIQVGRLRTDYYEVGEINR
jgi:hypothetical protein